MNPSLARLREELAPRGPPIVVFNKSHSGSRLLAKVLAGQRVFMGNERNDSEDALALVPVMEDLVRRYYPDYTSLWGAAAWPHELEQLVTSAFRRHLSAFDAPRYRGWGWKLCETTFILPVIDALFPTAKYIDLVRDGRDVAFCDHVAPEQPLWRKIYFNTDRIAQWRGRALSHRAYERASHIYNALHWRNSVEVGRSYGAMLRERMIEVRYEELCGDLQRTAAQLLAFLALDPDQPALEAVAGTVSKARIDKHRAEPRVKQRQVLQIIGPTLLSLGYRVTPSAPGIAPRFAELRYRLSDRIGRSRGDGVLPRPEAG
jgi:hypothetical protein